MSIVLCKVFPLFSGEYKAILMELKLLSKDGKKFRYEEAVELSAVLKDYQQALADFTECERQLGNQLGPAYTGISSDWQHIQNELDGLEALHRRGIDFASLAGMDAELFTREKEAFASNKERLASLRNSYGAALSLLESSFLMIA